MPYDVLHLLDELNQKTDLTVELGMQSVNEKTLDFINRGYDHKIFDQGVDKLNKLGIKTIAHTIIGLPDEDEKDFLNNIIYINKKEFWGIKIHNLYIENNTYLKYYYEKNNIKYNMTKDAYAKIVVEMLRNLKPDVVINRLTGDGIKENIAYPAWSKNKGAVLTTIDKIMKSEDFSQGDLFS